MCCSAYVNPFSISFVGGNLKGICDAGHTCPSLLPEDELSFMARCGALPRFYTYRLKTSLVKIFFPGDLSSCEFFQKLFLPKLQRWFVGWLEANAICMLWLCGCLGKRKGLNGVKTPPVTDSTCRNRLLLYIVLSFCRLYFAFTVVSLPFTLLTAILSAINNTELNIMQAKDESDIEGENWQTFSLVFTVMGGTFFILTLLHGRRALNNIYRQFGDKKNVVKLNQNLKPEPTSQDKSDNSTKKELGSTSDSEENDTTWRGTVECTHLKWSYSRSMGSFICTGLVWALAAQLNILWTYLTRGLKNRPVQHLASVDTVAGKKTLDANMQTPVAGTDGNAAVTEGGSPKETVEQIPPAPGSSGEVTVPTAAAVTDSAQEQLQPFQEKQDSRDSSKEKDPAEPAKDEDFFPADFINMNQNQNLVNQNQNQKNQNMLSPSQIELNNLEQTALALQQVLHNQFFTVDGFDETAEKDFKNELESLAEEQIGGEITDLEHWSNPMSQAGAQSAQGSSPGVKSLEQLYMATPAGTVASAGTQTGQTGSGGSQPARARSKMKNLYDDNMWGSGYLWDVREKEAEERNNS